MASGLSALAPLELSPEEMRRLGYRVIDTIVDHLSGLPEKAPAWKGTPSDLEGLIPAEAPETGADPLALLDRISTDVFGAMFRTNHPRFFAFVPNPSNYVSVLADALAAAFSAFAGVWRATPAAVHIELTVLRWLQSACGLQERAGGLFTSGGSVANLTGLAVARRQKLDNNIADAMVYYSDQTHFSIARSLALLGFKEHQLRVLPADGSFMLAPEILEEAIEVDRQQGRRPFCLVANAGTVNTGAVDPLPQLADICGAYNMWMHVDGAYGAAAALTEQGRQQLVGLDRADSLTLDPHKWLFQPYEMGCILVRDGRQLSETFQVATEYLHDVRTDANVTDFYNTGIQLTRSFKALKLWFSLSTFGMAAFRRAIEHGISLAELVEREVGRLEGWEVITPASLGIVTFRYAPPGLSSADRETLNRTIVEEANESGYAFLMSTKLREQTAIRICTINPRTTEEDIHRTIALLDSIARS